MVGHDGTVFSNKDFGGNASMIQELPSISQTRIRHWASTYVGLPYAPAARGPNEVDCWGLVYLVSKEVFNRTLPEYPGLCIHQPVEVAKTFARDLPSQWTQLPEPEDGCLVALSQRVAIHHCGIYADVDGGKVLHCRDFQNTIADTISGLRLKGFRIIQFYRWLS